MKHRLNRILSVLLVSIMLGVSGKTVARGRELADLPKAAVAAMGTAFTYQGNLVAGGTPATGAYDFEFRLFDALSAGAQVGSTLTKGDISVINGVFTVDLDFGASAFGGNARYLQISVRPGASTGTYTTLTPRQPIQPAPYALNADLLDGVDSSSFLSTSGGTLSGDLTVTGKIVGLYGGGITRGGAAYTNRFLVGNLPYNSSNASQKLLVNVWGGAWENTTLGQDFYAVSSRGGLKVTRTRLFGGTSDYTFSIYDNGASYDVVIEIIAQSYPNLVIRSQALGTQSAISEVAIIPSYDPTGKTNVTPTIENHIVVDNTGRIGIGVASPAAKLDVAGTARTQVLQITGGSDLAEPFEIVEGENILPGMLVAIDPIHPGQLRLSDQAYDTTVAGCVSGAGGVRPGLVMEQEGSPASGTFPVALSGRVYCYADASYAAIHPGDLLTSSNTPGHLMVASDYDKARGAIVGKAMTSLEDGQALILVLVSLQ